MSSKSRKRHTESSESHSPRKKHDRRARAHNEDVYGTEGLPKIVKWAMVAIAAVIVVTLTITFMAGLIQW